MLPHSVKMLPHRVQILAHCAQIIAHFVRILARCVQILTHFAQILTHCGQMVAHCVKMLARDLGEPLIGHRQDTLSGSMSTPRRSMKRHRSSNAAHWSSESRHWSPNEPHCESNRRLCDPFLPLFSYEAAHVILSDAHARADGAAPSYAIRASRRTCLLTATSCRAVRARRVSFSPPPRHVARTASPFPVRYGTARLPTQCLLRQEARHQGRSRRWVIAGNHARSRETARPRVAAARGSGGLHKRGGRLGPPEARWRRSRATGHLRRTSLARRGMHPSRQRSRSRDRAWRWEDGRRTSARRGTALRR